MIQLRGALTPQGSEAALQKVIHRQEVFRLSFLPGKEQSLQFIRQSAKSAIHFRQLNASQQSQDSIEELAREVFSAPFDLLRGPLYRAVVLSRNASEHVLVLAIHHAIADGWTLGVFVQDLFAAYVLGLRGSSADLPPVPLSYTQWSAAENAFWQGPELARCAEYWRSHLAGTPRLWQHAAGGKMQRHVTHGRAALGIALRELARLKGATLFTTLLAAFQITLSEWTSEGDIIVGTPVANRHKQSVRETAGYCSSIVPLRSQIDRVRSFADTLHNVHQTTVESFAHAMPFAELVDALGVPPMAGQNPVFQVRFALQNHPVPDVSMPGLSLQLRMRSTGTARFDLACEINEQGDALEIAWLFRDQMFDASDIDHLGRKYLAVLTSICHAPDATTSTHMTSSI